MKIICVDDEKMSLEYMECLLKKIELCKEFVGFSSPSKAFEYLANNEADVALLDINLGVMSGLELAKKCKKLCPNINIIFVTGHCEYSLDAFKLHASGYLLKPVRESDLRAELDHLRIPVKSLNEKRIKVQAFGNFDIFVDNKLIVFPRSKSKELLAYLVHCMGSSVTAAEAAAVLWEDKPYDRAMQNNTQKIISVMMQTLRKANADCIVEKQQNSIRVNKAKFDCDYYSYLSKNGPIYTGSYMQSYSWGEVTAAMLTRQAEGVNLLNITK